MRSASDFFAWRRERAGIPDGVVRRLLFEYLERVGRPLHLPIELEGVAFVERRPSPALGFERVRVWLGLPPPRDPGGVEFFTGPSSPA